MRTAPNSIPILGLPFVGDLLVDCTFARFTRSNITLPSFKVGRAVLIDQLS